MRRKPFRADDKGREGEANPHTKDRTRSIPLGERGEVGGQRGQHWHPEKAPSSVVKHTLTDGDGVCNPPNWKGGLRPYLGLWRHLGALTMRLFVVVCTMPTEFCSAWSTEDGAQREAERLGANYYSVREVTVDQSDPYQESPGAVDLVGDKSRPPSIQNFGHWWEHVQKHCNPKRVSGKQLAMIAWNAALEKAARELGIVRITASSADPVLVCRQFQVKETNHERHA